MNWRRLKLDRIDATAASGADYARATTIGLDLELDLVRRANKKLFVPEIAKRQKQRRLKSFPFPELAAARRATDRTARPAAKRGKSAPSGWAHHFPAASFSASGRAGGRRRATARALASGSSFPSDDFPPGTFPPDNFPTNGFPTDPFPGGGFPLGAWQIREGFRLSEVPIVCAARSRRRGPTSTPSCPTSSMPVPMDEA